MELQVILFAILGILAIATAIATVASRRPLVSAISLVAHFFMLAGLYLTLNAQFIAIIQILVYAGAIMVLVIFVIMLLNLADEEALKEKFNLRKILAVLFAAMLAVQLAAAYFVNSPEMVFHPIEAAEASTAESVGAELFTNYLIAFEAISILLIAAIVGAVVLAKRKLQ